MAVTRSRSATISGSRTFASLNSRFAGGAVDDRQRGREVDAELAFEPGLRRFLAGQLEHERMHVELDRARSASAVSLCSLRSWMQASMAGWMTMPQANGL